MHTPIILDNSIILSFTNVIVMLLEKLFLEVSYLYELYPFHMSLELVDMYICLVFGLCDIAMKERDSLVGSLCYMGI